MKILVIGSGGREHALVWKLASAGHTVLCAPGNPGIANHGQCLDIAASNIDDLVQAATEHTVDLVVIGPEAPLVAGLADRLRAAGVPAFGPSARGAVLEGSKIACKEFFARHGIPTARFFACASMDEAREAIDALGERVVVKADGLAAGKGVVVCASKEEALEAAREMIAERRFGDAGARVIIEERLFGRELSVMAITDGRRYQILAQAEDHKAVFDGDKGPNTGGMGTVSPCAHVTPELIARIEREVFAPTLAGLEADGIDYRGVLYAGLMIDAQETPWMLEYNCRFGDPETQPVMMRLQGDLALWLAGAAAGELPQVPMRWDERTAVCVVLTAPGYPAAPRTGQPITGLSREAAAELAESSYEPSDKPSDESSGEHIGELGSRDDVMVFHAGTAMQDGQLVTAGGRVLGVTALGADVASARSAAYAAIASIHFDGMHYRRDIGARRG